MKQKIILRIHIVQGKKDGLNIQIKYIDNIFLNKVVLTSYWCINQKISIKCMTKKNEIQNTTWEFYLSSQKQLYFEVESIKGW